MRQKYYTVSIKQKKAHKASNNKGGNAGRK